MVIIAVHKIKYGGRSQLIVSSFQRWLDGGVFNRRRMNSNEILQVELTAPTKTCYVFRRPIVVHNFWIKRHTGIEARKEAVT